MFDLSYVIDTGRLNESGNFAMQHSGRICDGMFAVGGKIRVPCLVVHVEADAQWTGNSTQQAEVCIAGEDVVWGRRHSSAGNFPFARIDSLPRCREIYTVDERFVWMCGEGIRGEMNNFADYLSIQRADPFTSGFNVPESTKVRVNTGKADQHSQNN